jgi:hypothetical protein
VAAAPAIVPPVARITIFGFVFAAVAVCAIANAVIKNKGKEALRNDFMITLSFYKTGFFYFFWR